MKIKSNKKNGPDIKASFRIAEQGIFQVEMTHNPTGFEWEICENRGSKKITLLLEEWLEGFCGRKQPEVALPIVLDHLPPYTAQVLTYMRSVPFGKTLSYKELATMTGKSAGARVAGNACGRNPCPLIIPCHRILASHGSLGGFSCGLSIKKALLEFEGIAYR